VSDFFFVFGWNNSLWVLLPAILFSLALLRLMGFTVFLLMPDFCASSECWKWVVVVVLCRSHTWWGGGDMGRCVVYTRWTNPLLLSRKNSENSVLCLALVAIVSHGAAVSMLRCSVPSHPAAWCPMRNQEQGLVLFFFPLSPAHPPACLLGFLSVVLWGWIRAQG
jgi:hypothetical protein